MKPRLVPLLVLAAALGSGSCARNMARGPLDEGVSAAVEDRWDDAVRYWQQAVSQDPRSAAAHNNLAVAYERRGAWEDARREYEEALRLEPANAEIQANFAAFKVRLEAAGRKTP